MDAEDVIVLIENVAGEYAPNEDGAFGRIAREELQLFRNEREPPSDPLRDEPVADRGGVQLMAWAPPFQIPARFRDNSEVWLVYRVFVECFLDPAECALNAARSLGELSEGTVHRISLVSPLERQRESGPIDLGELLFGRSGRLPLPWVENSSATRSVKATSSQTLRHEQGGRPEFHRGLL